MANASAGEISLLGKVVVVTGAAHGIGLAIANLAGACGAQVVSCDLAPSEEFARNLPQAALHLTGDVSREEDCDRFIKETVANFRRLDVLVNNAGIPEVTRRTIKQDVASWKQIMAVNLQGTYMMARAAATAMIEGGIRGSIINISSVTGLVGFRSSNAYGVSKAAVAMLTKTLAADLASRQIRVNAVAPGFIHTAMTEKLQHKTKIEESAFIERIPLQRFGDPAEIARAVVFLASDWASYITGAVLPVDGGWSAFGGPSGPRNE